MPRSFLAGVAAGLAFALVVGFAPIGSAQTLQTSRVMRQKLTESQQLLAAVVMSDWAALDRHTRALQQLTMQPGWDVMRMPEYRDYTGKFQQLLQNLTDASRHRDQRTAVNAYTALVTSCVECHRYVARARVASAR